MLDEHLNSGEAPHAGSEGSGTFASASSLRVEPAPVPAPEKERRHASFFEVVNTSLAINSLAKFCAWTQGELQLIFPHAMLACGIGEIENLGKRFQRIVTCNFPQAHLDSLRQPCGLISSPIIAQWIRSRRVVLFDGTQPCGDKAWVANFKRYGLHNIAAHGICDVKSNTTSYFTFAGIPGKLTPRHAQLLELLVPHLHVALNRALQGGKNTSPASGKTSPALTRREQEILQWLGSGKTNWEIAQVLRISENTVKNHVQRILIKLKVNNRAQAVAKGLLPR